MSSNCTSSRPQPHLSAAGLRNREDGTQVWSQRGEGRLKHGPLGGRGQSMVHNLSKSKTCKEIPMMFQPEQGFTHQKIHWPKNIQWLTSSQEPAAVYQAAQYGTAAGGLSETVWWWAGAFIRAGAEGGPFGHVTQEGGWWCLPALTAFFWFWLFGNSPGDIRFWMILIYRCSVYPSARLPFVLRRRTLQQLGEMALILFRASLEVSRILSSELFSGNKCETSFASRILMSFDSIYPMII